MAQSSIMKQAEKTVESSPWVIPGALLGTFVLTRLPLGLLTGLAVGFAAGWSLRAQKEAAQDAEQGSRRGRASGQEGVLAEDEKVDAMVDDSFPASDPPSYTAARTGKPRKS